MRCVVIVPFLNEAAHIGTFLRSLAAQSHRPDRVLLVDDGSTDASPEIAAAFAAAHPWASLLRRPPRPPEKDRLTGAPELAAFLWAAERAGDDHDVLVKMDADLELAPHHFARVLRGFTEDPRLGMAGVYLSARGADGRLYIERHPADHVRGPTRFYRRTCFEQIAPIPVMLGWDGADEVRARAHGWRTRSFLLEGTPTLHLRPTGLQDGRPEHAERVRPDRVRAQAPAGAGAQAPVLHPGRAEVERRRPVQEEGARAPAVCARPHLVGAVPAQHHRDRRDVLEAGAAVEARRATHMVGRMALHV